MRLRSSLPASSPARRLASPPARRLATSPAWPLAVLLVAVLAPAVLAPAVARAEPSENSPPRDAFLLELRLGGGTPFVILGATNGGVGITAVPQLLAGARLLGKLHLGLGFAFSRISGGGTENNAVTFAPTVEVDMIHSRDERVAMYVKIGLPLGPLIVCPQQDGVPCDNGFSVGFDFALGARYAFHRMFSLGLEAGAAGTFLNPQDENTTGVVTFYGNLVGSFMAGK